VASVYRPSYTKTDPRTGKRVTKKSRVYIAEFIGADGLRKRISSELTDKKAAQEWAVAQERKARLERKGIVTRHESEAERPIKEHINDFRAALKARKNTAEYVTVTIKRLRTVIDAIQARRSGDLVPSKISEWIQGSRDTLAPGTQNAYLRCVKSFSRWLWRDGRLPAEPLAGLRLLDPKGDLRRRRRALSEKDIGKLLQATRASTRKFRGLDGESRHALYLAALNTGLRAGELAALKVQDLHLDADPPHIRLAARDAKNRREARQPLSESVADLLAGFTAKRLPVAPVWPGGWSSRSNAMLAEDLLEAKLAREVIEQIGVTPKRKLPRYRRSIETEDEDGRRVDFHALRVSFVTRLSRAGVPLSVVQKLARHSDPKLTANVYTRLEVSDGAAAVEKISSPGEAPEEEIQATGTGDDALLVGVLVGTPAISGPQAPSDARPGSARGEKGETTEPPAGKGKSRQNGPAACEKQWYPQRDLNPCRWIENPVS